MAFFICTLCALLLCGIGIYAWNAKKAVHFWTIDQKINVCDIKKYNHAVGILWMSYAFEIFVLGIPLLAGQNSGYIVITILGTMFFTILMMVLYVRIEKKYRMISDD